LRHGSHHEGLLLLLDALSGTLVSILDHELEFVELFTDHAKVIRHLVLVVIFVADFKRMFVELVLLGHQDIVLHEVDEACIDVASLTHSKVDIEAFQVSETAHKYVVEVPVDVRVVRQIFFQLHSSSFVERIVFLGFG